MKKIKYIIPNRELRKYKKKGELPKIKKRILLFGDSIHFI